MSKKSEEILSNYWGYSHFRPLQEEIVDAAIYGKDVLALLPTGGGKSICFQVPGIAREGITIVVSPLIALMEDQVTQLQKRGIRAKALTSGLSFREIDILLDNAKFGGVDFLYISPERIQTRLFQERVKQMEIGLFVVDEAHCISEWGHDFRPEYRRIKSIVAQIAPHLPIIALTATATPKVQQDIQRNLQMEEADLFKSSFNRTNLFYEVRPKVKNESKKALIKFIKQHKGKSGIIYCLSRKKTEEIAELREAVRIESDPQAVLMELGDVLFSVVNLSRHLKVDAESALLIASEKFKARFEKVIELATQRNLDLAKCSLTELDELWNEIKLAK